ncbi:DNA-binding protein [Magnetococcales bacterium HHB-1]
MNFEFTIVCAIQDQRWDPNDISNKLFESGCDDATVFTGSRGTIGLEFYRESDSAEEAISSAIENIQGAFPDTEILEVKPDLVSLAHIADLVGQSRQNIRKLAKFPPPSVTGANPLWHLYRVIRWYEDHKGKQFQDGIVAVTKAAWVYNLRLDKSYLEMG